MKLLLTNHQIGHFDNGYLDLDFEVILLFLVPIFDVAFHNAVLLS